MSRGLEQRLSRRQLIESSTAAAVVLFANSKSNNNPVKESSLPNDYWKNLAEEVKKYPRYEEIIPEEQTPGFFEAMVNDASSPLVGHVDVTNVAVSEDATWTFTANARGQNVRMTVENDNDIPGSLTLDTIETGNKPFISNSIKEFVTRKMNNVKENTRNFLNKRFAPYNTSVSDVDFYLRSDSIDIVLER